MSGSVCKGPFLFTSAGLGTFGTFFFAVLSESSITDDLEGCSREEDVIGVKPDDVRGRTLEDGTSREGMWLRGCSSSMTMGAVGTDKEL